MNTAKIQQKATHVFKWNSTDYWINSNKAEKNKNKEKKQRSLVNNYIEGQWNVNTTIINMADIFSEFLMSNIFCL